MAEGGGLGGVHVAVSLGRFIDRVLARGFPGFLARGFLGFPGEPNFPFVVEVEDVQQAEVPRHSNVKSTSSIKLVVQRAKTITPV